MNRFDPVPILIGLLSVIFIILFIIFGGGNKSDDSTAVQNILEPNEKSKAVVDETDYYLTPQVFVEQRDVSITNEGSGKLTLYNMETSCNCFKAEFIKMQDVSTAEGVAVAPIKGQVSLAEGEEAFVRVTFTKEKNAEILSKDQTVTFSTTDPNNKKITINFYSITR